jgi:HK97 family phage major capsid protein
MPDERYRLAELREQRVDLHQQMDTIITTADTEERSLSAEDQQTLERLEGEFRALTTDIERRERLAGFDTNLTGGVPQPEEPSSTSQRSNPCDTEEYRAAIDAYIRRGENRLTDEQRSTLQVGVDADGGFTVAEEWASLQDHLRENAIMRSLARVVSTSTGGTFHIPKVAADAAKPVATAENAQIANDASEFTELTLGATKYARITKGSLEMVQDSNFDVAGFVAEELGRSLGLATDEQYMVGTGDGDPAPQGLFPGATLGVTNAASIGYDEIISLIYSLTSPYRANAAFLTHDLTVAALRKLKDTTNRPLWEPNVQVGEPDRLLGYPLHTSQFAPQIGAGNRPIAFGDYRRAYWIRDVAGISIQYLDQLYAENDQVGWKGRLRTSGAIVDDRAVRVLSIAP